MSDRLRELASKVDALARRFDSLALRSDDASGTKQVDIDIEARVLGMWLTDVTCRYKVTWLVEPIRIKPSGDALADLIQDECSEEQWKKWEYEIPPAVLKQVTEVLWAAAKSKDNLQLALEEIKV